MKCPYCGSENKAAAKFCGRCGKNIGADELLKVKGRKVKKIQMDKKMLIVICIFLIFGVGMYALYAHRINSTDYSFSLVQDRVVAVWGEFTGNKNRIEVSKEEKYMKIYAENIAETVLRQMNSAEDNGLPTNICDMAAEFYEIKGRKEKRIDCYSGISNIMEREMQKIENETDILNSMLMTVVGNVEGTDALAFSGAFVTRMQVETKQSVSDAVWLLKYTNDFFIGVVFETNVSGVVLRAMPITIEDDKQFYDKMDILFDEHKEYM